MNVVIDEYAMKHSISLTNTLIWHSKCFVYLKQTQLDIL